MSRLGDQSHQVANTDNGVLELSASVGFPLTEHVENHLLACRELALSLLGELCKCRDSVSVTRVPISRICVRSRFPGCPSIPSTSAITCVNCPCLFVGDRGKLGCIGPDRGLREVVLDIMGKLGGTKIKVDQELELGGAGLSWG